MSNIDKCDYCGTLSAAASTNGSERRKMINVAYQIGLLSADDARAIEATFKRAIKAQKRRLAVAT